MDLATVAYEASSGSQVWARRYDGGFNDFAASLAVSPDGSGVFVTGTSHLPGTTEGDVATVAYAAATGTFRWSRRYDGPGDLYDGGKDIAVGPDSDAVYVTGVSRGGSGTRNDYVTLAYSAV